MVAFKKILVPLDLGPASAGVLDVARMLADKCDSSLHLMHVTGCRLDQPQGTSIQQDVCQRLEALLDSTDRGARRATVSCQIGTPALEITRLAAEGGIDLIVMGTHRHAPTFQMMTGSVAESVVAEAPCAVLVVKCPGAPLSDAIFDPPATADGGLPGSPRP